MAQTFAQKFGTVLACALPASPFIAFAIADRANIREPIEAGQVVRVSSEPKALEERTTLAARGKFARVDPRDVWSFYDDNGRTIEVRRSQVPVLQVGDFVQIDQVYHFQGVASNKEAALASLVVPESETR